MIDLDKYRIFYEVAKEKNITKASENLYISQPAVSQVIKKLEDELGITLFIRNKKGVELTKFGKDIFQRVEGAMIALNSIDRIVEEESELLKGNLVIGSGSNVARELLTLPIKNFLQEFPNVQITQVEDVQSNMINGLRNGKIDIVISQQNDEIEDLIFYPLLSHQYVFVKAKGVNTDRFITISKGSYTQQLFKEFTNKYKKDFSLLTVSGYRMAIDLAKLGVGITLVPKFLVNALIDREKLETTFNDCKLPTVTFGYYINPLISTPATEVFIKFLKYE